jgi:hypothetical protein
MNILLVYSTDARYLLGVSARLEVHLKKGSVSSLGLLTVAALLPECYEKKLVDMNVDKLRDTDILWADYVFISAMVVQKGSVRDVIDRCKKAGVKQSRADRCLLPNMSFYADVDHLVLNEGEITIPEFLRDLETARRSIFRTADWADIRQAPIPLWSLLM